MADIHAFETPRSTQNPLIQGTGVDTIEHCATALDFIEATAGARHDDGIQGNELLGLCWIVQGISQALRAAERQVKEQRKGVQS